jgi:hypothetical protein
VTQNDIETVFGQRLEAADIAPIAFDNKDFEGSEYLQFQHFPNGARNDDINGGLEIELGLFLITAVIPSGQFTTRANELSRQVRALFPKALRMTADSGTAVINAAPSPGTGFQSGATWRQPVTISYITE